VDDPFNPMPLDPFAAAPPGFQAMFVIVGLLIALGFVFTIVMIVRNYSKARESGHDPFTLQTDLATRALDSELLAPKQSIEQRLAELDDLVTRGVITDEERVAARADILAGR